MSLVHRRRIFGDKLLVPCYIFPFAHLFVDVKRCSSDADLWRGKKSWGASCSPLLEIMMLGRL